MNRVFLFAALAALPLTGLAADTAYTAIRAVSKQNGDAALNHVLELKGRFGSPEPQVWKVVLAEPGSRGGVREFEVQRGHVTGERAPTGRGGGVVLDLNRLNIDSDGAFTIANQEAQKLSMPFDRVDYTLNSAGRGPALWHLELYENRKGRVGSIDIAADNGTILNRDLGGTGAARPRPPEDRTYTRDPEPVYRDDRRRPVEDRRVYVEDRRYAGEGPVYGEEAEGPGIFDIFGKVTRHFEKRSRQIKNFFTGR